jgi:hypothetical protein
MRGLARQYNGMYASEWLILKRQEENRNVRLCLTAERASAPGGHCCVSVNYNPNWTLHGPQREERGKVENGEAVRA